MKELTIEQKAKAYGEAIERAKKLKENPEQVFYEFSPKEGDTICDYIFPELAESEDEKIRKALIYHYQGDGCICTNEYRIDYKDILTWLEKQGEQKCKIQPKFKIGDIIRFKGEAETHKIISYDNELYVFADGTTDLFCEQDQYELVEQKHADKVKPKFHEGDWIIFNGLILHIDEIVKGYYRTTSIGEIPNSYDWDIDNVARLWTIQDAKDGDILASKDKLSVLIFRNLDTSTSFSSYYNIAGKGELGWSNKCFIPATKEQRDLLFQKMKEDGYEWDEKEKRPIKVPKTKEETGVLKQLIDEEKFNWSEEDEKMWLSAIEYVQTYPAHTNSVVDWLKSLKNRIQPQLLPQQECEIEHIEHGKYYYCIKDYYSGGNKRASKGEVVQAFRGMNMMALGAEANEYFVPVKCIVGIKSAWNEEDEQYLLVCKNALAKYQTTDKWDAGIISHWLEDKIKSIKNRVQPQPKQEWSEEDEERIKNILSVLDVQVYWDGATGKKGNPYQKEINWLKSLRHQNRWKPSDEQMSALDSTLQYSQVSHNSFEYLNSLFNDLKKLKGE